MSIERLELLAVDLDGTLVDSAPDIAHCLGHALAAVGFAAPGEARTRTWVGDGLETLIARALAAAAERVEEPVDPAGGRAREALHRAALDAFLECYRDHLFVRSRLYPDATETLDELRDAGLCLCCVTNKRHAFSEALLAQAGILDRFEVLIGGDSLAEKKPSPLPLLTAARMLDVEPSRAALFGDSHQDLRAARGAGFRFVLAAYGYGKVDDTELGAAPRVHNFRELPAALAVPAK